MALAALETDFQALLAALRTKPAALRDAVGDKREALHKEAQRDVKQLRELLEQMELDITPTTRGKLGPRVVVHREQMFVAERELQRAATALLAGPAARGELLGAQQEALDARQSLERSTARLDEALGTLHETAEVGVTIMKNLAAQREQIGRARARTATINADLNKSHATLTSMLTRARRIF